MAKDPAFLFYPGDWLGGTISFNRTHKGAYMDVLMAQFNQGPLSLDDIRDVLGIDFELMWEKKLKSKFKENSEGKFYNERLYNEQLKRKNYTGSRKKNLKNKLDMVDDTKHDMDHHMENVNENTNEIVIEFENEIPEELILVPNFLKVWSLWEQHRKEIKKKLTLRAVQIQLKTLSGTSHPCGWLLGVIEKGWQGIYDVPEKKRVELERKFFGSDSKSNDDYNNLPGRQ